MNLTALHDNALFLQSWRERMRPWAVVSAVLLALIIVVLIITNASLHDSYYYIYNDIEKDWDYDLSSSEPVLLAWYKKIVLDLCGFQGLILLFFGTLSAFRMSSRERASGTLDFHRSSPSSRADQVVGLLIGGPCLEWCLFLGLVLINLIFTGLLMPSQLGAVIRFNAALAFSAFFLHALTILFGIARNPKYARGTGIVLFGFLYVLVHLLYMNNISFLYHITWIPAYEQLNLALKGYYDSYHGYHYQVILYSLFGYKLDSLFFQCCVQVPFLAIFLKGITRKISHPDHPVMAKDISLLSYYYILFLFIGSTLSVILLYSSSYYTGLYFQFHDFFFFFNYTIFICGLSGAFMATPSQLVYIKGLRKSKKLGLKRLKSGDDHTGNNEWLICFCIITVAVSLFYGKIFHIPWLASIYNVTLLLSYVVFFACLNESFFFSRYHLKKPVFWTALIIIWIFVPLFGQILTSIFKNELLIQSLFAVSPFYGLSKLWIFQNNSWTLTDNVWPILIPPAFLALTAVWMAFNERHRLRMMVELDDNYKKL